MRELIRIAFIIMVPFLPVIIFGQNLKKYDKIDKQTFYINGKDSVLRFQALNELKPKQYNPHLTYFWYKGNTILKTMGGGDGRLLNGDYTCFYPNNNLKEKGSFKNGLKTGAWTTWLSDGTIKERSEWKNGMLHGYHSVYAENGTLTSSEKYIKGILIPVSKSQSKSLLKKGPGKESKREVGKNN